MNIIATKMRFYDSPRPLTCEMPVMGLPIFVLNIGQKTAYVGQLKKVTYWRIFNREEEVLAQGTHTDLDCGIDLAVLIPGREYTIERIRFTEGNSAQ